MMRIRGESMIHGLPCTFQRSHGILSGLLFIGVVLGCIMAPPVHGGLVDRITQGATDPSVVEERCRKGDASLCTSAGNMYQHGYNVTKDLDKAVEFYRFGCSGGETKSCYALYRIGFDDSRGKGRKVNMTRAVQVFTAACEGSSWKYSGPACYEMAMLHLGGKAVQMDIPRAVELLRRGCDRFSSRGCLELGNILMEGSLVPMDVNEAVAVFRKACDGKDKERKACAQLGLLFSKGEHVKRDLTAAERYLAEGCTFPERIGTACYELALLYEGELDGKKSEEQIAELYHVACHRADSERVGSSCVAAADRHLKGKGVKQDQNWVIQLYNHGCMLKHRESCQLSCEWNCKKGQPHACAAVKAGRYPLGVRNCFKP